MIETIPTPQMSSDDEYAIVATFSDPSLAALSALQSQLIEILGDSIWLTPQRALHSTVLEIICDRDYGTLSRKLLFNNWYQQYSHIVAETISRVSPVRITFSELEVSQRAIIVKSADSSIFNEIRSSLLAKTSLPQGTKLPPDITHCTIARYNTGISLEKIIEDTKLLSINFTEYFANLKLLKDLGPPTFQPKTLEEYALHMDL